MRNPDEASEPVPGPTLRPAKRRVKRATDHINEAVEVIRDWTKSVEGTTPLLVAVDREAFLGADLDEDELEVELDWSDAVQPDTGALSICAGECIYNLRAALDYLIYNLAWLDSGRQVDQTQFPIVDKSASWKQQRGNRLKGVNDDHAKTVSEYQPFSGCDWTRRLREYSNADKHRTLVHVTPEWNSEFNFEKDQAAPHPRDPSKLVLPSEVVIRLTFFDGARFPETLKEMVLETAALLERFQGDFGERDRWSYREEAPPD